MALFKILRGIAGNLANQPKVDGHAYFCWNDGTFWIDYKETADATEVKRKQINKESWTSDITAAVNSVKQWVEGKLVGKVDFFGTVSALTSLPTGASVGAGDFCRVGTAFTFGSETAHAGDMLVALKDNPSQNTTDWDLIHNEYDWTHTHNYTPAGTVSKPTFTGTQVTSGNNSASESVASSTHTHSVSVSGDVTVAIAAPKSGETANYTPTGTVSKPTFTGSEVTTKLTEGAISVVTGIKSATSSQPAFTGSSVTTAVPNGEGTRASDNTKGITTVMAGASAALNAAPIFTGSAVTSGKNSGTAVAVLTDVSAALNATPTFTGSAVTSGKNSGTAVAALTRVSAALSATPTFTGSQVTTQGNSSLERVIQSVTFPTVSVTNGVLTFGAGSISTVPVAKHGHTHTVTASGTVSKPSITVMPTTTNVAPNEHTHSVTSAGTVSKPGITITPTTANVAPNEHTHNVTAAGTVSKPGVTVTPTTTTVASNHHTHSVTAAGTVSTPTIIVTPNTSNVASRTHTHKVTAAGGVSQPTFTGSGVVVKGTFEDSVTSSTPSATVAVAKNTHTHTVVAEGSVSQPKFTGTQGTTNNPN